MFDEPATPGELHQLWEWHLMKHSPYYWLSEQKLLKTVLEEGQTDFYSKKMNSRTVDFLIHELEWRYGPDGLEGAVARIVQHEQKTGQPVEGPSLTTLGWKPKRRFSAREFFTWKADPERLSKVLSA